MGKQKNLMVFWSFLWNSIASAPISQRAHGICTQNYPATTNERASSDSGGVKAIKCIYSWTSPQQLSRSAMSIRVLSCPGPSCPLQDRLLFAG